MLPVTTTPPPREDPRIFSTPPLLKREDKSINPN